MFLFLRRQLNGVYALVLIRLNTTTDRGRAGRRRRRRDYVDVVAGLFQQLAQQLLHVLTGAVRIGCADLRGSLKPQPSQMKVSKIKKLP